MELFMTTAVRTSNPITPKNYCSTQIQINPITLPANKCHTQSSKRLTFSDIYNYMHAEVNLKVDSRRQDDKNKSLNKLHTSG
jgi:hypothetical protein